MQHLQKSMQASIIEEKVPLNNDMTFRNKQATIQKAYLILVDSVATSLNNMPNLQF